MSLQSQMVHTAWMGCGSSATPPSLYPNTGATVSCLLSSGSLWLCSGASCSPASHSATSGLWFPASRAVWLSHNASAASTLSVSRPSVIPSLKPWARSSAACVWHCVKKSKNSYSSVCSLIGWRMVSFYTPQDQSWHLAYSLLLLICSLWHAAIHPPILSFWVMTSLVFPFVTRSSVTAAVGSVFLWQHWHSWRAQCSSLKEQRAASHEDDPSVLIYLFVWQKAQTIAFSQQNKWTPNTGTPVDDAACVHYVW